MLPISGTEGEPEQMIEARASGDPFEALGDPNRRDILRLLSDGDKPVREIAAALPISRPAVSRHLRLLKEAGLVAEQAQGTRRIYHLQEQGMYAVQAYLERVWGDDKTLVKFEVTVDPNVPLPGFVLKRAVKGTMDAATQELRKRVLQVKKGK